jgi:hypothetical protein
MYMRNYSVVENFLNRSVYLHPTARKGMVPAGTSCLSLATEGRYQALRTRSHNSSAHILLPLTVPFVSMGPRCLVPWAMDDAEDGGGLRHERGGGRLDSDRRAASHEGLVCAATTSGLDSPWSDRDTLSRQRLERWCRGLGELGFVRRFQR